MPKGNEHRAGGPTKYSASYRALGVVLAFYAVAAVVGFFFLFAISSSPGWALLLVAIFLPLPLLWWVKYRSFTLTVSGQHLEVTRTFIMRTRTTLEFNKIEGIDIQQGIFGRVLGFGRLQISGVGRKDIVTEPVDDPDAVAMRIRTLVYRRPSTTGRSPASQTSAAPTKKCPFCAEVILAEAIKCKHCQEMLTT